MSVNGLLQFSPVKNFTVGVEVNATNRASATGASRPSMKVRIGPDDSGTGPWSVGTKIRIQRNFP